MKPMKYTLLVIALILSNLATARTLYAGYKCGDCDDIICDLYIRCDDSKEYDYEYIPTFNTYWFCNTSLSNNPNCYEYEGSLVCTKVYECWDFCDHKARNENNDKPNQACGTD